MKQLDSKAVWYFFFGFAMVSLIIIIVFLFGNGFTDFEERLFFWFSITFFIILSFVWAKLTVHFYRYELTEAGFRKESGVIYKKYVTVPYDRIQNVDINRGIIERLLGLSSLTIQTAGVGAAVGEGLLPGLSREVAEQLRDELIARARQPKNQGL